MKFFKKTIILFVILVIAGFSYWYFVKKEGEKKEEAAEVASHFFEETETEIAMITLKEEGNPPLILERIFDEVEKEGGDTEEEEEEKWQILSPVETAGETVTIKGLINLLMESKREEVVRENLEKKSEYGLDPPKFAVEFSYRGEDEVHKVEFGIENLDKSKVFVTVSGKNEIYSAAVGVRNSLNKSLFDLRDKRISPYSNEDIVGISVLSPVDTFVLEKKEDNEWYFIPDMKKASATRVDMYSGNLRWGNFSEVMEEKATSLEKYGFDRPRFLMNFKINDGSNFTFVLGDFTTENDTQFYYAMRSSDTMIFQVNADIVSRLLKTKFDLKDRTIFEGIDGGDVETVVLEKEGTTYSFFRYDEDDWAFSDTNEKLERGYKIDNIIRSMITAEYEEREPLKRGEEGYEETGIGSEKYTVNFTFKDDKRPPLRVKLTQKDEETGKLWMTPDDGETLYYMSGYFVSNFPETREELLE